LLLIFDPFELEDEEGPGVLAREGNVKVEDEEEPT
jgi:hypothetical protein